MSERQIGREKAAAITKQEEEDVRQLQEFDGFAKFSDDDLKRVVKAVASHLDVGAVAADPGADRVGRLLHPAQRGGGGVRRPGQDRRR